MRILVFLILLIAIAGAAFFLSRPRFGSYERWFAPKANLWAKWEAHEDTSEGRIDHSAWSEFLGKYRTHNVLGQARVNYSAVTQNDKAGLDAYVAMLSGTPIEAFRRDIQLAFWINNYNALTVQLILDNYPVASIRDIPGASRWFSIGPWDNSLITVSGEELTINDIEHRILRPIWREPRLHYVLNCASVGCPDLGAVAFDSDAIEATFDSAARRYVNDSRGVSVEGNRISVSRIYDWFISDLGGTERGIINHLEIYANPELRVQLTSIGSLTGQHYDWSLNAFE